MREHTIPYLLSSSLKYDLVLSAVGVYLVSSGALAAPFIPSWAPIATVIDPTYIDSECCLHSMQMCPSLHPVLTTSRNFAPISCSDTSSVAAF